MNEPRMPVVSSLNNFCSSSLLTLPDFLACACVRLKLQVKFGCSTSWVDLNNFFSSTCDYRV